MSTIVALQGSCNVKYKLIHAATCSIRSVYATSTGYAACGAKVAVDKMSMRSAMWD